MAFRLLSSVFAAGLLSAGMSFTAYAQSTPIPKKAEESGAQTSIPSKEEAKPVEFAVTPAPDDHAIGDEDAAATVIIYVSVTCPHCGEFFNEEWAEVKSSLVETGKARIILRPLPSPPMQLSMVGFMLAECAPREDYVAVLEDQFARQETIFKKAQEGGLREEYDAIAAKAGLNDQEAITACLQDETKLAHIHRSSERANASGIRGIPSFVINGQVQGHIHTAEELIAAVDAALEG